MTSRDLDELASALIDGLLDARDAAAAARDPAVAARATEMQAARQSLRQVPAPDPARRDATIAAALRAAGGAGPRAVPEDPGAAGGLDDLSPTADHRTAFPVHSTGRPVEGHVSPAGPAWADHTAGPGRRENEPVSLHAARRRRWADPRWLGAAAAAVLVLAVGGLLATRSPSNDADETAGRGAATEGPAADSPASGEGGQAGAESSGAGGGRVDDGDDGDDAAAPPNQVTPDQAPGGVSGGVVDLGEVGSAKSLAEQAGAVLDDLGARVGEADESLSVGDVPATATRCVDPLATVRDAGPLVLQGRATLDGQPVEVWVHDGGSSRRLVATDASCAVVADRFVPS